MDVNEKLQAASASYDAMFAARSRGKITEALKHVNEARAAIREAHGADPLHEADSWDYISPEVMKLIRA